eukprot:NODE_752_length_4215_cov_0.325559.p4 type:complete len:210 gc:universal NODE_752_length_4215_cov_0.325559:1369-740(-)
MILVSQCSVNNLKYDNLIGPRSILYNDWHSKLFIPFNSIDIMTTITWQSMISTIDTELSKESENINSNQIKNQLILYKSLKMDWASYIQFNPYKYTRHLVYGNANYTILVLCWGPNQKSPIHDHGNSHCFMKILQGELHEIQYNGDLQVKQHQILLENDLAYIQTSGIHQVGNHSNENAVSLHIYSPPLKEYKTFSSHLKKSFAICRKK